jgi:glycosyltransferase involved in cell wall biosynthesis
MKIAIVCDWLITVGGAEKVLYQMLECFPEADLYSLIDFLPDRFRYLIHNKKVTTSFIQKLPFARKCYRKYLPLMPLAIEQFDFSSYDVVISSSHSVAKGILVGPNQLHICYCHSPIRYAWDLQSQYLRESKLEYGLSSWLARILLHKIRIWDYRTGNSVDHFIANSKFIAKRIYKIYRREAKVIYPPVTVSSINDATTKSSGLNLINKSFYVAASRIVPYKKLDLIISAFLTTPQRELVVIGDGPLMARLKQLAQNAPNIKILGYQPDEVLSEYLAAAKAFIFAAEEDFGLIPVEAQALGTPVIAYARGGALETVIGYKKHIVGNNDSNIISSNNNSNNNCNDFDNITGILFEQQTVAAILEAIDLFEGEIEQHIKPEACVKNAERFAPEKFRAVFKQTVMEHYAKFREGSL